MLRLWNCEAQTLGADWNGPLPAEDNDREVWKCQTHCPLCDADQAELQRTISPLGPSGNFGIDVYLASLSLVQQKIYLH